MSKILIFGAGGQLGRELSSIYTDSIKFYHSDGINSLDFSDIRQVEDALTEHSPDLVLNAAALANVDLCEKDHKLAYTVNGQAINSISKVCRKIGTRFVHISTDYVFDGIEGNYRENSIPNPLNYYGLSKLVGDLFALSNEDAVIVRTSGVFGYQKNFPLFVLETLKSGNPVNAFQGFYSPIHARNLAKAIALLLKTDFRGLINISGDRISRSNLAQKIANSFSLDKSLIHEVRDLKNLNAKRPFDSSLNNTLAKELIDFDFSSTDSNIEKMREVFAERN